MEYREDPVLHRHRWVANLLCNSEQIIPINTLVVTYFLILTDPTGIHHNATLGICFRIQKIVAFGAEV